MEKEGVSKQRASASGVGEKVGTAAYRCHGSISVVVATFCLAFIRLSESEQREEKKRAEKEKDKGGNERESYFRRPLSFFSLRSRARAAVPSFLGESRIIRGH